MFHLLSFLIGLGEGLTSIDFVFFRSKVKDTKVFFCKKMVSTHFLENYLSHAFHRAFICNVLIGLSEDKTHNDFGFTRSNRFCSLS